MGDRFYSRAIVSKALEAVSEVTLDTQAKFSPGIFETGPKNKRINTIYNMVPHLEFKFWIE